MKNKKDITKIILLTCLFMENIVLAQNFYSCMPKKSWIINVVKEEQEAERRRIEEEIRKREEEERRKREEEEKKRKEAEEAEKKRKAEEEKKRKEREICLENKRKCEKDEKDACMEKCCKGLCGEGDTIGGEHTADCRYECDNILLDCGTCP